MAESTGRENGSATMPLVKMERPGVLHRLFLRNIPFPVLVQRFLQPFGGDLRFLEDVSFPASLQNYLKRNGIETTGATLFLHDRRSFRAGVVLERRRDTVGTPGIRTGLGGNLDLWLERSGRKGESYRLLDLPESPLLGEIQQGWSAVLLVLWRAEKPLMDRWVGGGDRELLPELRPVLPDAKVESEAGDPPGQAIEAKTETKGEAEKEKLSADPVRIEETRALPLNSMEGEGEIFPSMEPIRGTPIAGEWRRWKNSIYSVAGHHKGLYHRKLYLVPGKNHLRLVMLASPHPLAPEYIMAFFDMIHGADDSIEAHRELLEAAPGGDIASFSLEIDGEGLFRAVSAGIRPLLWRDQKKRLRHFPSSVLLHETDHAEKSDSILIPSSVPPRPFPVQGKRRPRIIRGKLKEGDLFLLTPGEWPARQLKELDQIFLSPDITSRARRLGDWMDSARRGRGMILALHNQE